MKPRLALLPTLGLLVLAGPCPAQLVTYTFGPAATPTTAPTALAAFVSASLFAGVAGSPGTASGSPVHSAGSGGAFFSASAWTGAGPGTNRFEFTVTPAAGRQLDATTLSFAYRATTSGPTSFVLRSSADAFASNLLARTLANDTTWHTTGNLALDLPVSADPLVLRLHAFGASSALGTWRIDDVVLGGAVTAVPEPGAAALGLGLAAAAAAWRRLRSPARETKRAASGRPRIGTSDEGPVTSRPA
jgi:hypothetical protein